MHWAAGATETWPCHGIALLLGLPWSEFQPSLSPITPLLTRQTGSWCWASPFCATPRTMPPVNHRLLSRRSCTVAVETRNPPTPWQQVGWGLLIRLQCMILPGFLWISRFGALFSLLMQGLYEWESVHSVTATQERTAPHSQCPLPRRLSREGRGRRGVGSIQRPQAGQCAAGGPGPLLPRSLCQCAGGWNGGWRMDGVAG